MEKILLIVNASKPDQASAKFAVGLAARLQTRLTGLLIENTYQEIVPLVHPDVTPYATYLLQSGETTAIRSDVDQSVRLLREECRQKAVGLDIIIDKGEPVQQAIYESRFADFIILEPGLGFSPLDQDVPSHFVKEVLSGAECPVLLAPNEQCEVEEVIFCYDGSASSVFAIKQFAALLPVFSTKAAILLQVKEAAEDSYSDDLKRMMAWMEMHFATVYYQSLEGRSRDELFSHLLLKTNKMVVMGAYGRNFLSQFFRRSHADLLIRMVDLPIFISHR